MKAALVQDRLNVFGGSERVLGDLHDLFPDAPIYTSIADLEVLPLSWRQWDIRTSKLQSVPFARKHHRLFLPLIALHFEQLDLSDYDLVISNSHCAAKAVVCKPGTFHVCYCHTPLRYAWTADPSAFYSKKTGRLSKSVMAAAMHWARLWDYCSAARVDHFIASSQNARARIKKYYGRESSVVYPGVDISRFQVSNDIGDYYLVLSRMMPYKRLDLAVSAASKLNRRLVVIGSGPDERMLKKMAGPSVEFWGNLPDHQVADALSHCKAFLFPGEEDFGLTPIEAQACGRPVIAYGRGGATETVIDGVTGLYFNEQTVDALCESIVKLESMTLDPCCARKNAERFSIEAFKQSFCSVLNERLPDWIPGPIPSTAAPVVTDEVIYETANYR
jgi:glycosyltransferase involved in cell wall biosynthesis